MADRYLIDMPALLDGYLLEDGSGVLLIEESAGDAFLATLHRIEAGVVAITAAGLGGVLQT